MAAAPRCCFQAICMCHAHYPLCATFWERDGRTTGLPHGCCSRVRICPPEACLRLEEPPRTANRPEQLPKAAAERWTLRRCCSKAVPSRCTQLTVGFHMSRQRFSTITPAAAECRSPPCLETLSGTQLNFPCAHVQVPTGRCRAVEAAWPLCEPAAASAAAGASRSSVGATSVPGAGWQIANPILRGARLAQEN